MKTAHDVAWRRLQAGDVGGAARGFSAVLKRAPDFYPSVTGLGYANLADRQFKTAAARFAAATAVNDTYLPAWLGRVEAELAQNHDVEATAAMERVLAIAPGRADVRTRLELVRFRRVQALIEDGRRARAAGKLEEARATLSAALALSPETTMILRELAETETKAGRLDEAERFLRRVVQLEPNDADGHAVLAAALESRGKYREASAAYARAAAIDPRQEWRDKASALRETANLAALPAEFKAIAAAASLTRADVAAFVGIRLDDLIDKAPKRPAVVATDVRNHWAAPWIVPVTRAGVMDVYPNHTFQPAASVRRGDLAQIVAALIGILGARRPAELARWRASRPKFADLTPASLFYQPAAVAVAAGALSADAGGRFQPTRPATGADLSAAVARLELLSGQ